MNPSVPRGIEVLVKKAAVDPVFRADLLARRAAAAEDIGLPLDATEAAMLAAVPGAQLETIIARTSVPEEHRRAFLGKAAAAMLAAVAAMSGGVATAGGSGSAAKGVPAAGGARPDGTGVFGSKRGLTTEQRVTNIVRFWLHVPRERTITRDTSLAKDLKADAAGLKNIRQELEKLFPVKISAVTLNNMQTVGELIDIVEKAVEKRKTAVENRKPEKPDRIPPKLPPDRIPIGGIRPNG